MCHAKVCRALPHCGNARRIKMLRRPYRPCVPFRVRRIIIRLQFSIELSVAGSIPRGGTTMKRTLCLCLGLSLLAWSLWAVVVAQEPAKSPKKVADAEPQKQESAIRASVAQFVKAYNAHD